MKTVLFTIMTAVLALAMSGGFMMAEAHDSGTRYYNIIVDELDYERTEYSGFDLVRMNVTIENLDTFTMRSPLFVLGGAAEYVDDPLDNPNTWTTSWYYDQTYSEVRGRGGDVTVDECTSADRFSEIPPGHTGETSLCFMIGKAFEPDGFKINHGCDSSHWVDVHGGCGSSKHSIADSHSHTSTPSGHFDIDYAGKYHKHYSTHSQTYTQVIPFHDDSISCFDLSFDLCNADNIQPIDGTSAPRPAPEPEPAEPVGPASLLYALYNNNTGTLTMVFDQPVVASNPDRISLIHDVDAFIEDGVAPDLGEAELSTADNKRQSAILAFTLDDVLRLEVAESLRTHGDLVLLIDSRAIYTADGFTDITPKSPMLVPDITVVW